MKRKPGLKKPGQQSTYTHDQIQELIKCQNDPVYFIENYVYIRHAKRGRLKFAMYDYQKEMARKYHTQQFNIVLSARQTGKTETSCAYLLWFAIFHKDKTVLVASNKGSNAMEIIRKIQFAYEELPDWIKPGIDESNWNKHTCTWENSSRIVATTTSEDSGRGMSISLLYCLKGDDSYVTVRNKATGVIETVSIKQLYERLLTPTDDEQIRIATVRTR